jgi:hypothetical protein
LLSDGRVAEAGGSQQHDVAAAHQPLRRGQLAHCLLQVRPFGLGEDDGKGWWTRHRSLLRKKIICLFDKPYKILS